MQRQQKRIDKGVSSGALTASEAQRLERKQDRIEAGQDKAAADGHISKAEHHRMQRAQDRQSKRIHRQKHDAQHAASGAQ
jgi:hypothetical protein